jgi:hypothetical protein
MAQLDSSRDVTQKMLQTIRESIEAPSKEIVITNDNKFGDNTLTSEKEYISSNLNSTVRFSENALVFYPDKDDLTFSGEVPELNNLRFQFRLNDPTGQGVYIWVQQLQLTDVNVRKVQLIHNLFLNWKDRWVKNAALLDSLKGNQ